MLSREKLHGLSFNLFMASPTIWAVLLLSSPDLVVFITEHTRPVKSFLQDYLIIIFNYENDLTSYGYFEVAAIVVNTILMGFITSFVLFFLSIFLSLGIKDNKVDIAYILNRSGHSKVLFSIFVMVFIFWYLTFIGAPINFDDSHRIRSFKLHRSYIYLFFVSFSIGGFFCFIYVFFKYFLYILLKGIGNERSNK